MRKFWIARDQKGCLMIFSSKPKLIAGAFWSNKEGDGLRLPKQPFGEYWFEEMFKYVSFSNSPIEVTLKIDL